jgi:plasmid segregation protein ParM
MSNAIAITGGLDIGNGYVKGALRGLDGQDDKFDFPSGLAVVTEKVELPTPDAEASTAVNSDFWNNLDASFTSPLIDSPFRHLFGRRGLLASSSFYEEFDVQGNGDSKAEQPLAKKLILGTFAAKAVKDYVNEHGVLPNSQLEVSGRVGLALPIDEYLTHRSSYAAQLKASPHLVIVGNFASPVTVKITFVDVQVVAEGSSAQYAITQRGVPLVAAMLKDVERRGFVVDGFTAEDIYHAQHTVGIDIGEGTVNFPVYSDQRFNADVSRTFTKGYGTMLQESLPKLAKHGYRFDTRKKLADYLMKEPGPTKKAAHDEVSMLIAQEAQLFAQEIVAQFGVLFSEIRHDSEVAYVFGGGSGPLREALHPLLLEKVRGAFPVLYLDASYSRHLNREGLLIAAGKVEELQAAKKTTRKRSKATVEAG